MDVQRMIDLAVCQDCIMIVANDDDSGIEDGPAHRDRIEVGVFKLGGGYLGCGNSETSEDYGFTTTGCDLCGDECHGDKFPAHLDRTSVPVGAMLGSGRAYSHRDGLSLILPGTGDALGNSDHPPAHGRVTDYVAKVARQAIGDARGDNYRAGKGWRPWPLHTSYRVAVQGWPYHDRGSYRFTVWCESAHMCGDLFCPECGEQVRRRELMFLRTGWAVSVQPERLMWEHRNNPSPLCPTMTGTGYQPSLPVRVMP